MTILTFWHIQCLHFDVCWGSLGTSVFGNSSSAVNNTRSKLPFQTILPFLSYDNNDEKVVNLIKCITPYKTVVEFDNRDFNADKIKLYEEVRKLMAKIYEETPALFGPVCAAIAPPEQKRLDNSFVKRGYTRIQEKVKPIRQTFTQAVSEGRQSGSCKILTPHYDELVQIWGGLPASESLSYGVNTDDMKNNVNENDYVLEQWGGDDGENNNVTVSLQSLATKAANTRTSSNKSENSEPLFEDSRNDDNVEAKNKGKKRNWANCVLKLMYNKSKNMERQFSASQIDQ